MPAARAQEKPDPNLMALDQEDRERICCDLADLCRYETDEVWSDPLAEQGFFDSPRCRVAFFRRGFERRLKLLQKLKGPSWRNDYEDIQKCIKRLDGIRIDEEAEPDDIF